jgi:RNA polymerase sigma factor (sigma-70 family)
MGKATVPPPDFEETYREHRLALVRLAYLLCGSRELSEDLVQTVFAAAHPRWEEIENHLPYLRQAVVNLAKDSHRRRLRRLRLAPPPEVVQVTTIPEIDETWSLILRLPSVQRAVVVLHYYEDLPLVEVASILNRPPSTVRSDLRRALERLRKALT